MDMWPLILLENLGCWLQSRISFTQGCSHHRPRHIASSSVLCTDLDCSALEFGVINNIELLVQIKQNIASIFPTLYCFQMMDNILLNKLQNKHFIKSFQSQFLCHQNIILFAFLFLYRVEQAISVSGMLLEFRDIALRRVASKFHKHQYQYLEILTWHSHNLQTKVIT